jgi:hypothetical protein
MCKIALLSCQTESIKCIKSVVFYIGYFPPSQHKNTNKIVYYTVGYV